MTDTNGRRTDRSGNSNSETERSQRWFKTLIVDGNAPYRTALQKILSHAFPAVTTAEASTGSEALALIETFNPDIILLAIQLPGAKGLSLACQIRRDHPKLNIILITSQYLPEYHSAARKCGIEHLIARDSWSGADIIELLRNILDPLPPSDP